MMNTATAEYLNQALLLSNMDKFEEALSYVEKAEAADPMDIDVYFRKGELYVMLDMLDEAQNAFEKALLIDKQSGEAYFHLGNVTVLKDDFQGSKNFYAKAIANGFDAAQVYVNLCNVSEHFNDYRAALDYADKAIKADKYRGDVYLKKIELLRLLGRVEDITATCDKLIETNPDVFEGYHIKFLTLVELGKIEAAEETLKTAMILFPDDPGFMLDKVRLLMKKNDSAGALKEIDKAIDNMEEVPVEFYIEKSEVLLSMAKPDEASSLLEVVVESEYNQEAYYLLLNIYIAQEKFDKALEVSEKIISSEEDTAVYYSALYYRGLSLKKLDRNEQAQKALEEANEKLRFACTLNPMMLDLYIFRALALFDLNRYEECLEMTDYVLSVADEFSAAHLIKAQVYEALGNKDKAAEETRLAGEQSELVSQILEAQ